MLESLTIKNTAIIDNLTVEFGPLMNCMTGETGAGKSIIIDSLCCLLGERVSKDSIRAGASEASVTGIFSVPEGENKINACLCDLGIEPEADGTLMLYRAFTENKNTCRVNDRAVTLTSLKKLGELLVDVHGQHDNHALLSPATHISLLDSFAGKELSDKLSVYRGRLAELKAVDKELEEISGDPQKRAQLIDLLNFQVSEIFAAHLRAGEDDELEKKQELIDNSEKITKSLNEAETLVSGFDSGDGANALDIIGKLETVISKIERFDESFAEALTKVRDAKYALLDVSDLVRDALDGQSFDPDEAQKVAERIDTIYELKRKYGNTIEEILAFGEEAQNKLETLEKSEENAEKLLKRKSELLKELEMLSAEMHEMRSEAAKKLEEGVKANLTDMEMGRVKFAVKIDFKAVSAGDTSDFSRFGLDEVAFMISTNPAEPLKPLSKIASGGELSRIMLAIKAVLADVDDIPVLVFDEIDTGISGAAAVKVAEKFRKISGGHQVICVSHLAQIAAIADENIVVTKSYTGDNVTSSVENMRGEFKIAEIARLLDGDPGSKIALDHARELIERLRK